MNVECRIRVRIRYVECDPMNFLHHSRYLPFLEMARTELLRLSGVSYRELEDRDVLFAVTKVAISYKRPARYDDELEIVCRIVKQTHVRIDHTYEIFNTATKELLSTAETTIACINKKGEVQQIPEFLGGKFDAAKSS